MSNYSILIHSGSCDQADVRSISDIEVGHRLIICSFQSLLKSSKKLDDIIGNNTFVVVDEAHHIVAPSYYDSISSFISNKDLIGLTATPIRSRSMESSQLYRIFDNNLGIRVHMTELFQRQFLVRPLFEIVNYETKQLEDADIENIGELNEWLVTDSEDYNDRIVNKYISDSNPLKYGKTVVFAINKRHANSLYEAFCNKYKKEKVFLVYSGLKKDADLPSLPNYETRDTQFDAFKKSEDGILINVNVLNEGVDIPDIKTVFLTKPLNSKIAVTQIIGRALRPAAGKKCAYIVNFAVSNLGRKIMMVMPKTAYAQYAAEWEGEEAADEFEENEERVSQLEAMAEKAKNRAATCSFSDICLAGNYSLLSRDEQEDIPVPVSFKEYRKIEHFRNALKSGKSSSFPKRLFFNEIEADVVERAFIEEGTNYDITFKPYDEELLSAVSTLLDDVKKTVKSFYEEKKMRNEYIAFFANKYQKLKKEENAIILWYLNQVGIRNENDFIFFMIQELPEMKRQIKEEM